MNNRTKKYLEYIHYVGNGGSKSLIEFERPEVVEKRWFKKVQRIEENRKGVINKLLKG